MKKIFLPVYLMAAVLCGLLLCETNAQDIDVSRTLEIGLTPPTPIAITGFSGEVARVLDFDLTVMGFKNVPADSAKYVLSGSNNGNVSGQLAFGRNVIFSKAYSGQNERAQAHRLADDVVMKITGVKGIAESRIAFKAGSGALNEIYVADFDGHNRQAVTSDHSDAAAPCWVPGKLALYYTSYKNVYPAIFYQNLATGQRQNFAHYGGINSSAAVSPDGSKVAMILSKDGSPDVYVCDAGAENPKRITTTRDASALCWSPDGRWICFGATVNGRMALYKVPSSGGAAQRIPTSGVLNPTEPDWSPDGKWIAFSSHMGEFSLCVVPASGGTATILSNGEDPSWAPNSRTIIFVKRGAGGSRYLSLLDAPTKQVKDASRISGSGNSSQPSWAK